MLVKKSTLRRGKKKKVRGKVKGDSSGEAKSNGIWIYSCWRKDEAAVYS